MRIRIRLPWKIVLLAILAPAALGLAALGLVNYRVSEQVRSTVDESLRASALVCERVLKSRADALESSARVIVQDPRFFAVMGLGDSHDDKQVRATVKGVALDFNQIAKADLFEVFDSRGRRVASIGRYASRVSEHRALLARCTDDEPGSGLLVHGRTMSQVVSIRAFAGGRRVGTLVIGQRMGNKLAADLRALTRSEVTFMHEAGASGSTLPAILATEMSKLSQAVPPVRDPSPEATEVRDLKAGGTTYLTLFSPIPGAESGARIGFLLQRSIAQEMAFLGVIQRELVELAIVTLIPSILISLIVSLKITRRLLEVVRAAEEMERGNYDSPLEVKSHDEIGYLATRFRDMRQHEREYVNALEAVARLKSDFIALASHELRTPASIIKAYGELLSDGRLGPVTGEQRNAFHAIGRSVNSIVRISDDASALAHVQGERSNLQKSVVPIADVINEAVAVATSSSQQRRLQITVNLDPDLGHMYLDGPRLGQAVSHLVRNAIRFTPDDGSVNVSSRREGSDLVVEVRDTGIGISEERQAQLFSRSFMVREPLNHHSSSTLEFNSAGLGLGLPIAHGIAQAHGGSLSASSRFGQGSTFVIRIPDDGEHETREAA